MGNSNEKEEGKNNTIQSESQRIEKMIDEKRATYQNPLFPFPPKETIQKFIQMGKDIGPDTNFYDTKYYHDLIPYKTNINWAFAPLKLVGATAKEHSELLDKVIIPDDEHKYTKDIQQALDCFNKWRKWKEGSSDGWIYKKKQNNVSHFIHTEPNENLNVAKGESVIVYPTPVIAGILLNGIHRNKYDSSAGEDKLIQVMSLTSFVIHSIILTPYIVADRDLCVIMFVYCFRDGSFLMGTRSIKHENVPVKSTPVRANLTQIWHIRPFYEHNIQQSRVTYYLQMDLSGSLPYSTSNDATLDAPQAIYNVAKYIKSIHYELPKKGTLHIPPYPMLKNLGIDIGWMDIERDNGDYKEIKNEATDDIKEAFPTLIAKEYVFKKLDKENNKVVCLDNDFNDIVFDLSLSKSDILEKINGVIDEGQKQQKDVMITVTEKNNNENDKVLIVSDANIALK